MNEDFLHFIWKHSLFTTTELRTTDGALVQIQNKGFHNHHAGPDFLDARITVDSQLWAGHVEIHVNSSNWYDHNHHRDEAYDNVILHVVLEDDRAVFYPSGQAIPTLVIDKTLDWSYHRKYKRLLASTKWIPCEDSINKVESIKWTSFVHALAIRRLERKTGKVLELLELNKGDWEETAYQFLCTGFGFKVNADPMLQLARSLPLNTLRRHKDDLFQLEALLLGQAGFLQQPGEDAYAIRLHNEYSHLSRKFNLRPMPAAKVWKRFRMMPRNFPEVRLAQLSSYLHKQTDMVDRWLEFDSPRSFMNEMLVEPTSFWDEHYTLHKSSPLSSKKLGRESVEGLCINTVVPFLFCLGRFKASSLIEEKAIQLLEACRSEHNSITRGWRKLGFDAQNALESQGSIELRNEFCSTKKCLNCVLGTTLLKTENKT